MRISLRTIIACLAVTACEPQSPDYFPLAENLVYEYSIVQQVNEEKHRAKLVIANLAAEKSGNEIIYPRITAGGEILYFQKRPGGIYYSGDTGVAGHLLLKYPPALNATWRAATDIYILKRRHESFAGGEQFISLGGMVTLEFRITGLQEIVDVPAGRFTGCIRVDAAGAMPVEERTRGIQKINIEQTEWYAPDAGLVKMTRKEYTVPDKIRAEMVQELTEIKHL